MKVTKSGVQYDAEQLTSPRDIPELGLVNVPIGTWIISESGTPVQCPSDEAFKEFYTGTVKTKEIPKDDGNKTA